MDGRGSLLLKAGGSAVMARHDSGCGLPSALSRLSRPFLFSVSSCPAKVQHDQ